MSDLTTLVEALTGKDQSWKQRGACVKLNPDLFYLERGASTKEAKSVCFGVPGVAAECPVRQQCLEYALSGREKHGIWGGLSERERRRVRRVRAINASRETETRICDCCGKTFVSLTTAHRKCCSDECVRQAAAERSRRWREAHRGIDPNNPNTGKRYSRKVA